MTMRHALLALSALTLPAAASAQYNGNWPVPGPWMARPAPSGQAWQSPAAEQGRAPALEPIDLPPAIEQGVDMIYIDESLVPKAVHRGGFLAGMQDAAWSAA